MWTTKHTCAYNLLIRTDKCLTLKSYTGNAANIAGMLNTSALSISRYRTLDNSWAFPNLAAWRLVKTQQSLKTK